MDAVTSSSCDSLGFSNIGKRDKDYNNNNETTNESNDINSNTNCGNHVENNNPMNKNDTMEKTVAKVLERLAQDSIVFERLVPKELPQFTLQEVTNETLLGQGEFGMVYEVVSLSSMRTTQLHADETDDYSIDESKAQQPPEASSPTRKDELNNKHAATNTNSANDDEDDDISDLDDDNDGENGEVNYLKDYMVGHTWRCGFARYAIKKLSTAILDNDDDNNNNYNGRHNLQLEAAIDLACEATFLASLSSSHPNIVKIRATVGRPGQLHFGIIMDRLQHTLGQKIELWSNQLGISRFRGRGGRHRIGGWLTRMMGRRSTTTTTTTSPITTDATFGEVLTVQNLFMERLLAVYDIARAMNFLHDNNILFRDLKPENVGVNLRGDYLIFDFGLSKELKVKDLIDPPDGYQATGLTGSRRYMAPEVVWCKEYGFAADVYSYGILFWETFALQVPFENMTIDQHFEQVVVKGKRPPIKALLQLQPKVNGKNKYWKTEAPTTSTGATTLPFVLSKQLQVMLEQCWADNSRQRPKFKAICEQLKDALTHGTNALETREGLTDRTKHLLEKSHASRSESIKECC